MSKPNLVIILIVFWTLIASHHPLFSHAATNLTRDDILEDSYIVMADEEIGAQELNLLSRYGVVSSVIGRVAVLEPRNPESLKSLSGLDFITLIRKPREYRINLDISVPDVGASARWDFSLPDGSLNDGRGIIIGIIDTGIDFRHPDFYFPDGRSKIIALWDMTISGRPPAGFTYGHECTRSDIEAGVCPSRDTFGHGTGVASVAAGSGMALGRFRGVAPGAYIVAVKAGEPICRGLSWSFSDREILDGMRYLINKSEELGMRLVVNLSLGQQYGGHDGTDPLEVAIDDAVDKERVIFTVSAGNSGDEDIHAILSPRGGEQVTLSFTPGGGSTGFGVTLWFSKGGKYEVELNTAFRESVSGPTPPTGLKVKGGTATISFASLPKGDSIGVEFISEEPSKSLPADGWSIAVKAVKPSADARIHAWISSLNCDFESPEAFRKGLGYEISYEVTVGIPGTSEKAITVGAYVTRVSWVSLDGFTRGFGRAGAIGELAAFSSRGPTRDGRLKPELTAPGAVIVAAGRLGRSIGPRDVTEYHMVWAGTSFSAPHVAGAIALLLQANPMLTRDQALSVLAGEARLDSFTGTIPPGGSSGWGYGKLNALAGTGYGRALVKTEGLPSGVTLTIEADGEIYSMRSESALAIAVRKGLSVAVKAQPLVEAEDTRFSVNEKGPIVLRTNEDFIFSYAAYEYYLKVETDYGNAEGGGWYKVDSTATVTMKDLLIQLNATVRVRFAGWRGAISSDMAQVSVEMSSPKTLIAVWIKQFLVSVTSTYGEPEGSGWYDEGSEASVSIQPVIDHGNGTRRVFQGWSGDLTSNASRFSFKVDGPKRIEASWRTEYLVRVRTDYGEASGAGWYGRGATATISVSGTEIRIGPLLRVAFKGWRGDISADTLSISFAVTSPIYLEAVWETDYTGLYVTIGGIIAVIIVIGVIALRKRR